MISIKVGDVITVEPGTTSRAGETAKGQKWFFAKAQKGYDIITIWADNVKGGNALDMATALKIGTISAVKKVSRKDANGKWHDEYQCNAVLEPVAIDATAVSNGAQPRQEKPKEKPFEDLKQEADDIFGMFG